MLKFNYLANLGIAGLLVLPPALIAAGESQDFEKALQKTLDAITGLTATQEELQTGDYAAVEKLLHSTEAPLAKPQEQDAARDRLRVEVSRLQTELDELESGYHLPEIETESESEGENGTGAGSNTGLTDAERSALGDLLPPVPGVTPGPVTTTDDGRKSFEKENYSASIIRQGRAYYRAGRYEEAIALLKRRPGDAEADYWIARCYERLERPLDAIRHYDNVIANEQAGSLADRAKSDRDFVEWRQRFERKLDEKEASEEEKN